MRVRTLSLPKRICTFRIIKMMYLTVIYEVHFTRISIEFHQRINCYFTLEENGMTLDLGPKYFLILEGPLLLRFRATDSRQTAEEVGHVFANRTPFRT